MVVPHELCLNRVDIEDQEDILPDVGPAACTLGASTPCTRSTVNLVAAEQSWPAATSRGTVSTQVDCMFA